MHIRLLDDRVDELGVLGSTLDVMQQAGHVTIDQQAVAQVGRRLHDLRVGAPEWDDGLHFRDGTWRTAGWVLALDALNFCFWSEDPSSRWLVAYRGEVYDGYWALVAALRRVVDEGAALWDPAYLAELSERDVKWMLRPAAEGAPQIPLLAARVAHLRELGRGLRQMGGSCPVEALIGMADRSVVRLVQEIVARFPSFNDVSDYRGRKVRFFKRAQILAADLHGAFSGEGLGKFDDLDTLTAFADYKVPQVLRRLGILVYSDSLARKIDRWEQLPAGREQEVEIRAATVWGVELLRQELARHGKTFASYEIDWLLWQAGQTATGEDRPYHRTLTPYY